MTKQATAEQMGRDIQYIRHYLIKHATNIQYHELRTKKLNNDLIKAIDSIDRYRNNMDNRLTAQGIIPLDIDYFYGGIK